MGRDREEPKREDPLEASVNLLTGAPYSTNFYKILAKRKALPAWRARKAFVRMCTKNREVILVGETGSGKTTQCPQYLLLEGLNNDKMIAVTQPRRVAAMSVAQRVAEEFDCQLGQEVGYTIRYDDTTSDRTKLKFCTDGMLLREAISDPLLSRYSFIILDEAHERTMQTDILFGVVKGIMAKRDDLTLVVMSATLDSDNFQRYFNGAPIVTIPGRTFPVELFYATAPVKDYVAETVSTVMNIHCSEPAGDILVFLTGEEEIENCCEKLREEDAFNSGGTDGLKLLCLPLYSALPPHVQQKVFKPTPEGCRKVVVGTNVAETSITIDGIVYVVDPGFSKQKVYNARKQVESLLVTEISQASAQQRSGRAGRTRPGKCFRLYPESAFAELEPQTHPEIIRSSLNNMVINLLKLGVSNLVTFDYFTPPAPETLMRALSQLHKLQVIIPSASGCDLTSLGRQVAELPLDPQQARMLLMSAEFGCTEEILTLCAMLSGPQPFMRPRQQAVAADRARKSFAHQDGDHLTLVNVFNAWAAQGEDKDWAYQNYLQDRSLQLAKNVRRQLSQFLDRMNVDQRSTPFGAREYYRDDTNEHYWHESPVKKRLLEIQRMVQVRDGAK